MNLAGTGIERALVSAVDVIDEQSEACARGDWRLLVVLLQGDEEKRSLRQVPNCREEIASLKTTSNAAV